MAAHKPAFKALVSYYDCQLFTSILMNHFAELFYLKGNLVGGQIIHLKC